MILDFYDGWGLFKFNIPEVVSLLSELSFNHNRNIAVIQLVD